MRMSWVAEKWKYYGTKCPTQLQFLSFFLKTENRMDIKRRSKRMLAAERSTHSAVQSKSTKSGHTYLCQLVPPFLFSFKGSRNPISALVEIRCPNWSGSFLCSVLLVRNAPLSMDFLHIIKRHKLSGLEQQKSTVSQLWRPEVPNEGASRAIPLLTIGQSLF